VTLAMIMETDMKLLNRELLMICLEKFDNWKYGEQILGHDVAS